MIEFRLLNDFIKLFRGKLISFEHLKEVLVDPEMLIARVHVRRYWWDDKDFRNAKVWEDLENELLIEGKSILNEWDTINCSVKVYLWQASWRVTFVCSFYVFFMRSTLFFGYYLTQSAVLTSFASRFCYPEQNICNCPECTNLQCTIDRTCLTNICPPSLK